MNFTFEWITDWNIVLNQDFKNKWTYLFENSSNKPIFYHPEIALIWINYYKKIYNLQPLFCIATINNSTIFFPLVIIKERKAGFNLKKIVQLGYEHFDYLEPVFSTNFEINLLKLFWIQLFEVIKNKFNFDVIKLRGLKTSIDKEFKEEVICPYKKISEFKTIDNFLSQTGFNFKRDIKRKLKLLNSKTGFEIKIHTQADSEIIDQMLYFHSQKWQTSEVNQKFYKALIYNTFNNNKTLLFELKLDNISFAWLFGFVENNNFLMYLIATNPDYKDYSSGKILIYHVFEYCINNKFEICDFLRGDDDYKNMWTTDFNTIYSYFYANPNIYSKFKRQINKYL